MLEFVCVEGVLVYLAGSLAREERGGLLQSALRLVFGGGAVQEELDKME